MFVKLKCRKSMKGVWNDAWFYWFQINLLRKVKGEKQLFTLKISQFVVLYKSKLHPMNCASKEGRKSGSLGLSRVENWEYPADFYSFVEISLVGVSFFKCYFLRIFSWGKIKTRHIRTHTQSKCRFVVTFNFVLIFSQFISS